MKKKEKFKVYPGLSITGKELQQRLRNRTVIPKGGSVYTDDIDIVNASRMSKADIHRAAIENANKIESINKTLKSKENEYTERRKQAEQRELEAGALTKKIFKKRYNKKRFNKWISKYL